MICSHCSQSASHCLTDAALFKTYRWSSSSKLETRDETNHKTDIQAEALEPVRCLSLCLTFAMAEWRYGLFGCFEECKICMIEWMLRTQVNVLCRFDFLPLCSLSDCGYSRNCSGRETMRLCRCFVTLLLHALLHDQNSI